MGYKVELPTYQDAAGLADAMTRAMYEDEHYVIILNGHSLQEIIDDSKKRVCRNLSNQRETLRHEKVVDEETGEIVGYARWELPEHLVGDSAWPEAQMPKPTEEQQKIFQQDFDTTMENGGRRIMNREVARLTGSVMGEHFAELVKEGPYLVVDCLITAPSHQQKGIATLLLNRGEAKPGS